MIFLRFIFWTFLTISWGYAQERDFYVDYAPQYTIKLKYCILDKIAYTQDRTIFYFRYIETDDNAVLVFHGTDNEESRWCLVYGKEVVPMIELRNVVCNGKLIEPVFKGKALAYNPEKHDVYTMEVHFPALPAEAKRVDFLEGYDHDNQAIYFDCLKVKIKPYTDKDLGKEEQMQVRVSAFETKVTGKPRTNFALPKPEPKEKERESKAQDRE